MRVLPVTAKGRHDTALLLRGTPPWRPNLARSPGSSLAPGSLERKGAETVKGVEAGTSVIRESPAARRSDRWVESRAGAEMPPPHLMQLGRFHT